MILIAEENDEYKAEELNLLHHFIKQLDSFNRALMILYLADQAWWVGQIIFSVIVCIPLTIWMYRKLSPQHINKKWMKDLISGSGGKQVQEALDLMEEIENFEEKTFVV